MMDPMYVLTALIRFILSRFNTVLGSMSWVMVRRLGVQMKPTAPAVTNVSVRGKTAADEHTQNCQAYIPKRVQGKNGEAYGTGDTMARPMTPGIDNTATEYNANGNPYEIDCVNVD